MVYNFPMFEVVCKKSYFSRQTMKLTIKVCLVLLVRPIGTRNQDLRALTDSFQHNEFNGNLRSGKQAFVENHIFRGKLYYLNLHEILVYQ